VVPTVPAIENHRLQGGGLHGELELPPEGVAEFILQVGRQGHPVFRVAGVHVEGPVPAVALQRPGPGARFNEDPLHQAGLPGQIPVEFKTQPGLGRALHVAHHPAGTGGLHQSQGTGDGQFLEPGLAPAAGPLEGGPIPEDQGDSATGRQGGARLHGQSLVRRVIAEPAPGQFEGLHLLVQGRYEPAPPAGHTELHTGEHFGGIDPLVGAEDEEPRGRAEPAVRPEPVQPHGRGGEGPAHRGLQLMAGERDRPIHLDFEVAGPRKAREGLEDQGARAGPAPVAGHLGLDPRRGAGWWGAQGHHGLGEDDPKEARAPHLAFGTMMQDLQGCRHDAS